MLSKITPYTRTKSGRALNLDASCTYYLAIVANQMSQQSSKIYRDRFGVGVVEWRCLVVLALEVTATAARICELSNMNKSLVSRAMAKMEAEGYVEGCSGNKNSRPRPIRMTASGKKLHDELLRIALSRERKLRKGLTENEVAEFLRIVKVMRLNADTMTR